MAAEVLKKIYYDTDSPGGFGGINRLLEEARKQHSVTFKDAEEFLQSADAYTLHKDKRKQFKRNRYMLKGIDDLWQADLGDFQSLAEANLGVRYILFVIDSFSKFLWAEPLGRKDAASMLTAIKNILQRARPRKPANWLVDKGLEFQNQQIKSLMKEKGINSYHTNNPDTKAAIAERVIRTIKGRMYRYMTHYNTKKYIDVLQSLIHAYNTSKHRTIGMNPADVNQHNENAIRKKMFPDTTGKKIKFRFKVGDMVRLSRERQAFDKGYHPGWTEEVFTITKAIARAPPVYKVADVTGETVEGTFYEPEIQKVRKDKNDYHIVESILNTRIRNGRTEYLIKWQGYPDNMSSWEPAENVKLV